MKVKELRELNDQDLIQKERALKKELFDLNFQRKVGNLEKPGRFKITRKTIAQIKTLLKERILEKEKKQNGTAK